MTLERFVLDAVRVALLLGLGLTATSLLRRAPSATRRLILALSLAGALVLPVVSASMPAWRVDVPVSAPLLRGKAVAEPFSDAEPASGAPSAVPEIAVRGRSFVRGDAVLSWSLVAALVWAAGALLVISRLAVGLARARTIVRRAKPAAGWSRAIADAERALGCTAEVRVTDELDAPAVSGVLAPVVLVPAASSAWSFERKYAVLLHELAHVRQGDCLVAIVATLACAMSWFDPLAWLALRRLRVERELAADDAVIAAGARATDYAEALLAIAGEALVRRDPPAGALGMAGRAELASRVVAIVSADRVRRRMSRPGAALLAFASVAVLFAIACATPTSTPEAIAARPSASPPSASIASTSTIDPRLQAIAEDEVARAVAEWQAPAGTVLVLDPATGEILANAGRADGAPADVAVRTVYVPGSTLKAVTLAAALDDGVVAATARFDCESGGRMYGSRRLYDAGKNGVLSLPEMLAVSSNVGFSRVFDRIGGERYRSWLERFHFGAAPPLDGAATGVVPARIESESFEGATVAIGQAMSATPLQMAAAFAALANDGVYVAPTQVRRSPGDTPRERLVRETTARAVVTMLREVVDGEQATGRKARVPGVAIAGKTGTSEWDVPGSTTSRTWASFIGIAPADHPRFVVLVGVESPRGNESGGNVAAPAFARVVARALAKLILRSRGRRRSRRRGRGARRAP